MVHTVEFREDFNTPQIEIWKPDDIVAMYGELEVGNWPPWYRFTPEELTVIQRCNPKGQFLIRNEKGSPIANLVSQRLNWNGQATDLPRSWDYCAGYVVPYQDVYQSDGNTMVLLVINVALEGRGQGLPRLLTAKAQQLAQQQEIEHIISPFRPSEYGACKVKYGELEFAEYCLLTQDDGWPVDPWLRSLAKSGMQPLAVCEKAVETPVTLFEFHQFQSYHPERWRFIGDNKWECGETGVWYEGVPGTSQATYVEPNIWGEISLTPLVTKRMSEEEMEGRKNQFKHKIKEALKIWL